MNKRYLLVFTLLLLGCEPEIRMQPATEQKAYLPFEIGFDISDTTREDSAPPQARLFNKYNLAKETPVEITPTPKAKHEYTIHITSLEAGDYRLILSVPYRVEFLGIPLWRRHKTLLHDFIVHNHLPDTCFNFDDKDNAITGWKSSHVFIDNKDKPVSQETCPGLFFVENSWPWPLDKVSPGGSLFVPISSECFPKASSQVTSQGRWMFSILSPDLSSLPHWQNIKSVQFRIATKNITIYVRPELHYQLGDNKSWTPLPVTQQRRHEITKDQWHIIEMPVTLDKNAKVTQLELHISGIPEQTVTNTVNSIFIDGICPIQAEPH